MFKFLRKKRIQSVIRAEELEVGDRIQLDLWNTGVVTHAILVGHEPLIWIKMRDVTPEAEYDVPNPIMLPRDLNVLVWR